MSQKYLIRIAELERLLSEQAEALRQKDQQLSLVEETEAFLRSALTRAEEKIEEDEREIEHLRAQIEKLRRMLFGTRSEKLRREVELAEALLKQREQDSDRYSGRRFPASCDSRAIVVRYRHTFPVKYTAWSQKKAVARSVAVSWIIWGKSALNSWNW
ncbi:transposase [Klebsiella pneumoniae]|nr:transposase [Klebsiella pneumoniae]SYC00227.1 transposase [Klebsiella pneumoniae]SYE09380.1 transposase [Klebsiella pneumoniae]VUJ25893.1 transposase [Klebsiella pneumoniae]